MVKKEIVVDNLLVSYSLSSEFNPDQAIVFLPGWKSPVDLFCSIVGDLPNLVAINLPGWGGSEKPHAAWGLVEYADFLKEFLSKLGINNSILIGHSVGAAIATEYLARGGLARKLMIVSGALIREKKASVRLSIIGAKIFRFFLPFVSQMGRRRLAGRKISVDYGEAGELVDIYRRLINEDEQINFSKLALPILLIWGQDDQDTPLEYGQRLAKMNQRAELAIIPQAGHYSFLDQPEAFRQILKKFL